jgi:MFS family permease
LGNRVCGQSAKGGGVRRTGSGPNPDALDALRVPFVRAFIVGRVAATLGMQFVSVAVGWELYERTGDPWALGLVGLAQVAPALVLTLPAGNLADRFARRHVAMLSQLLMALAAFGLAAVSWLGAPVEIVYSLLVVTGVARALAGPSVGTLLPQLLQPRQFGNANAWLISSFQLASITGPAVGGLLIWLTGSATSPYILAGIGELVFVAMLGTLPVVPPPPGAAPRTARDLFAGIGFIRRNPVFLAAITLDLFAVLLGGAVALLPVFAKDILGVGPAGLGLLRSAPSLGAITTALIATRLRPWQRPGRVLLIVVAGFGVATIGFGLSRDMALSLVCLYLIGAFDSISMVIRQTLQQVITPDHLRGRVAAVGSLFVGLSNEMGAFESGAAAALFGPVIAVAGGGVGTLIVVAIVAVVWPSLARIGPLHTLRPAEVEPRPAPKHAGTAARA